MKVVALCNKLSRSRLKLRGDGSVDLDVNGSGEDGSGNATLGVLNSDVIGRTSPGVSNMTTGREAAEVRY